MVLDGVEQIRTGIITAANYSFKVKLPDATVEIIVNSVQQILDITPGADIDHTIQRQISLQLDKEIELNDFKSAYYTALRLYKEITGKETSDFYHLDESDPGKLIREITKIKEFKKYTSFFPIIIKRFNRIKELLGSPVNEGTIVYMKPYLGGVSYGETETIKSINKSGQIFLNGKKGGFDPFRNFITKAEYDSLNPNSNLE